MIVKRFFGKNRTDIEAQISREWGPEAIILLDGRSDSHEIELTVAIEESDLEAHSAGSCMEEEEDFWHAQTLVEQ